MAAQENNMNIQDTIKNTIEAALATMGVPKDMAGISLTHPADTANGDYSTNLALLLAQQLGANSKGPIDLANKIAEAVNDYIKTLDTTYIERVEVAGPGFINFYLTKDFFTDVLKEVLEKTLWYGKSTRLWNKKIIIEHTNMNPFKPFHIGHLVNNAIGESLTRVLEFQDAKVSRANYGGDVGMHVAKTVWGILKKKHDLPAHGDTKEKIDFIGEAYVFGSNAFDTDETDQQEIKEINQKIFAHNDAEINEVYDWGREVSLKYFQTIYKKLDTRFDYFFFESEVANEGVRTVQHFLERGIFEQSQGAVIFPGEKYGLHNRVFLSSQGLPTYEAKELGLTKKKFELHDFNKSIIVTATEQNDYFKVILKVLELMYPEIASRTEHIGHGMMRLTSGKMSSRKGNVVTGESLIEEIEAMVSEKVKDRELSETEKKEIVEAVALGAIKYSILKQSIGKDIVFDPEKSISFDGDSGPYLQYTYVRTRSILAKALEQGIESKITKSVASKQDISPMLRMLNTFPEIIERASDDNAPNYIATYLTELASAFNAYYAQNKIVDPKDETSPYKIALTEAVGWVLKNGLHLLGIHAPEKM